jgi:hypothetical protein
LPKALGGGTHSASSQLVALSQEHLVTLS